MRKIDLARRRAAEDELKRALTAIIARGGAPEIRAIEALQAVLGRGWIPGRLGPAYCPTHRGTRLNAHGQCPTCGPGD